MANKVIGFWDNNLSLRGTTTALYDYAKYNEEILGNKSVIFAPPSSDLSALDKFKLRFGDRIHLTSLYECEHVLLNQYAEHEPYFYFIKAGNDGAFLENVKTLVHAVFASNTPHGHRYRYVSDWLAKEMGYDPDIYAVPHMVDKLPEVNGDLRDELNIPRNATVFGCYGGSTEFNINFVRETMNRVVSERNDVYFIFMNISNECRGIVNNHPNFRFLPGSWDLHYKSRFIKTCDAMLHARDGGETFGLAVAEFSVSGKPVLTFGKSGERSHLEILGEKGLVYNSQEELYDMINHLDSYLRYDDYNCYQNFSPEIIMKRFQKNFLD